MPPIQTNSIVSTSSEGMTASDVLGYDTFTRLMEHIKKIRDLDFAQQKSYADDFLMKVSQQPTYPKLRINLAAGFLLKRLIDVTQRLKDDPENPELENYRLCAKKLNADHDKNNLIAQMAQTWDAARDGTNTKREDVRSKSISHLSKLFSDSTKTNPAAILENFTTIFAHTMGDVRYKREKRKKPQQPPQTPSEQTLASNALSYAVFVRFMGHVKKIKDFDFEKRETYVTDLLSKAMQNPVHSCASILPQPVLLKRLVDVTQRLKNEPNGPDLEHYRLYAEKLNADKENDLITQIGYKWFGSKNLSEKKKLLVKQTSPLQLTKLFTNTKNEVADEIIQRILTPFADIKTPTHSKKEMRPADI